MEFQKPQPPKLGSNEEIEQIKNEIKMSLIEDGTLEAIPEEFHNKTVDDIVMISFFINTCLPNQENGNGLLQPFSNNLIATYFTLGRITKHQVDCLSFLTAYTEQFNKMMSDDASMGGMILKMSAMLGVTDGIGMLAIDNVMESESMKFVFEYTQTNFPDIHKQINDTVEGMSTDEIEAYAQNY